MSIELDRRVEKCASQAKDYLMDRRRENGSWVDRLSSSTVSTALGALSVAQADPVLHHDRILRSVKWLRENQRADGGWSMADSVPPSSPGMTAFAIAALHKLDAEQSADHIKRAWQFIEASDGWNVIPGLRGETPKTWPAAAPIIWSIVGLRDEPQPDQPVEIMLLPALLRNKVSIALPVILALGIMQHRTLPRNPFRRLLGKIAEPRALNWLRTISGTNGGIEECPMIAGFVYLALNSVDVGEDLQLASLQYLLETQRHDGSWAIDRDLEISVTAYSIMALAEMVDLRTDEASSQSRDWLLRAQWNKPFGAFDIKAGGWSWALPSGWPETEDTAVVLGVLADFDLSRGHPSAQLALHWLRSRQNRDGSWSEWVRNSAIMNDRPCAGVTCHVVMTLHRFGEPTGPGSAIARALGYLKRHQKSDGSIDSVWFRDSVHGTSRLLETYATLKLSNTEPALAARNWLLRNQSSAGGWPARTVLPPAHPTVEETAWAVFALLKWGENPHGTAIVRGVEWLIAQQDDVGTWTPSNVGLYFDDLCYTDDLIAHTFALRALGRWLRMTSQTAE
ncbi:prenyltransferase/squalene oxidase repeat-containing protein [Antrihabitans spumae]|uniref:Prenyltransferase/squalene oxidase repeat-containing protein n=1 Tax=Antrihabitans spumae TaxID=3373370 RepID=A0ABW7KG63_9NOCA